MDDREGSRSRNRWRRPLLPASGEKRSLLISLALLLTVIALLVVEYLPRTARFETGKPSPETVISPRDFDIVDEEATLQAREAERRRNERLFVSEAATNAAVSRLGEFLAKARSVSGQEGSLATKASALLAGENVNISLEAVETILDLPEEDASLLYAAAVDLLTEAMSSPVAIDNLAAKKTEIAQRAQGMPALGELKTAAKELAAAFLTVNTPYTAANIKRDVEEAMNAVPPVLVSYSAGQKIVEKGEVITPITLAALNEMGALSPAGGYQQLIGISLLAIFLYGLTLLFFRRYRPETAANWRVVAMICLVLLVFCVSCRICAVFMDQNPIWGYLVPLALVGLSLAVLLDHTQAMFMVVAGGVITALLVKGNIYITITALLGGLAGVLLSREVRKRVDLMRTAVELSLFLAATSAASASLVKGFGFTFTAGLLGAANGLACAVITLGSLPLLERVSGIVTPMHLLELASPDQPLLKELISKAPGTYSHSVIVGNLADAAAQEIGGDALLARVGAYYHDVGKIKRSSFFVENQPRGFNGHERIKPNLSALVITAHVREGVEMAREYRLPAEVVDIIRQHHGTSLVRYFYARALEERGAPEAVPESRFRYPGVKPQSKEAAIVMLADAIEAAAKALEKPTPVKLEQLTRSLTNEKLQDGQLSESNLTLGDLEKINRAFIRILTGMYHERVEYPRLVAEEVIS